MPLPPRPTQMTPAIVRVKSPSPPIAGASHFPVSVMLMEKVAQGSAPTAKHDAVPAIVASNTPGIPPRVNVPSSSPTTSKVPGQVGNSFTSESCTVEIEAPSRPTPIQTASPPQSSVVSSGPHYQDSGEAKIRESTAGVSRKPSSDCKACGCSSKHLCGLTAWNT